MTGAVDRIVDVIARTAPEIRSGLTGRRRKADEENPSGETQMAADVWADRLLAERLTDLDGVDEFASEERGEVLDAGAAADSSGSEGQGASSRGGYGVAVDPLDGSSNLRSNNSMGTVLGVYDAELPAKGRDLVAAAYVLYGPITTMVVARDGDVTEYVVEDSETQRVSGEAQRASEAASGGRRAVTEDLTLPDDPVVYGFGGRVPDWTDGFTDYAREIETELKLRYGGAMIGDVNQVLTYGGVFAYPALESRPEGKLRLQFEANPIAYIVESAGGRSSDGDGSLLDVEPTGIHQRVPVHVGNAELVDRLEAAVGE